MSSPNSCCAASLDEIGTATPPPCVTVRDGLDRDSGPPGGESGLVYTRRAQATEAEARWRQLAEDLGLSSIDPYQIGG